MIVCALILTNIQRNLTTVLIHSLLLYLVLRSCTRAFEKVHKSCLLFPLGKSNEHSCKKVLAHVRRCCLHFVLHNFRFVWLDKAINNCRILKKLYQIMGQKLQHGCPQNHLFTVVCVT